MLNKVNRLTKRKEFGFIYKNGKKLSSPNFTLVYIGTKLKNPRFGFVVSKKVGKAHTRNKLKRQMREIVRLNLTVLNPAFNYVVVAKPTLTTINFATMKTELLGLMEKLKNN